MPKESHVFEPDNALPKGVDGLLRLLPPVLVALFYALRDYKFIPVEFLVLDVKGVPQFEEMAQAWQFVGLIVPALYLASVGPTGLVSSGKGFLVRILRLVTLVPLWRSRNWMAEGTAVKMDRIMVALMGLVWLGVFLWLARWLIETRPVTGVEAMSGTNGGEMMFLRLLAYAGMHAGLMSGVGVFVFLAALPEVEKKGE